jgi:hypothetical protein
MKKLLTIAIAISIVSISYGQDVKSRKSNNNSRTQSRSAKTGQYVSKPYADKHKSTTYTSPRKTK